MITAPPEFDHVPPWSGKPPYTNARESVQFLAAIAADFPLAMNSNPARRERNRSPAESVSEIVANALYSAGDGLDRCGMPCCLPCRRFFTQGAFAMSRLFAKPRWAVTTVATACVLAGGLCCLMGQAPTGAAQVQPYESGIVWDEPSVVTPGTNGGPPSDAIVLFDGKNMDAWKGGEKWEIENGEGVAKSFVETKQPFGDCQLHVEFATPKEVKGKGQGRGNNGIGFMGARYEIQVLDSWENPTYLDGMCAAVYKQHPPLVNASRKPGEWQTYDIVFEAPRFKDGKLARPAYATVLHNGVLVQNHFQLLGNTAYEKAPSYTPHEEKLPLVLMYHGNPVRFRNIWIREIKELDGKRVGRTTN
jgi:3-keto-disaccharide hydrolase